MRTRAVSILSCAFLWACGTSNTDVSPRTSGPELSAEQQADSTETEMPAPTTASIPQTVTPPTAAQATLFAESTNGLAFDLWARVRTRPGNQVLSPASIALALYMAYGGARGQTAAEMRRVLHITDADGLHEAAGNALSTWNDPARDTYTLAVANRLFGERGLTFEPEFLELTRTRYRAPLEPLDFSASEQARVHINGWVAEQTRDRILNLIPKGAITPDTGLVLTNAVYFLGRWLEPFEQHETRDAEFFVDGTNAARVPTMHRVDAMRYAETPDAQVVELPYLGNETAMTIVLPRARDGLDAVEAQLDGPRLAGWISALDTSRPVQLALPKFRVAPEVPLAETLRELGMPLAFQRGVADFTGIANPTDPAERLHISEVFHKAFVEVDEEGTEAAAATGVVAQRGGVDPTEPVEVRVDHPFLFLIRDVRSGAILFLGRVVDPS